MRSVYIFLALILLSNAVRAATVQMDGSDAIGISNLAIDGGEYDVAFGNDFALASANGYTGFNETFGFDQGALASNTVTDMAILFNNAGVIGLEDLNGVDIPSPLVNFGVAIYYASELPDIPCFEGGTQPGAVVWGATGSGAWRPLSDDCVPVHQQLFTTAYFKSSVVPIPAAVWLFGSALAGLGWFRRKAAI
jgi:hypothetical protein